jgi:hypothetical protein
MLYTAIIVEPRKHKALPFVLENFLNNLSEDWSFIIFHGTTNLEFIVKIINNNLNNHIHRIRLMNLGVDNLTIKDYNNLLKYNKYFYECIPTETFLIFQTDSISIKKYNHLVNNFLHYDYVGAPWNHFPLNNAECVGNGGLSLRKKSKMIEIMKKQGKNDYPEDVYFSCCDSVATHKPSLNDAMLFSIEETFSEMSFGCHQPWKSSNQIFLYETYDEVKKLYNYNDIPPPNVANVFEPAVPPPPPQPQPQPQPKPVERALPPPPPQPKPVERALLPPSQTKPAVPLPQLKRAIPPSQPGERAPPPPKPITSRVKKNELKELYNYNKYKF